MLQLCLFLGLCAIRALSSLYMIIPDCDETYNYWEPLNLLLRGFGKQTWEYSPDFAIRSYAYLFPYYLFTYPVRLIVNHFDLPSYWLFYFMRLFLLGGLTVFAEIKLYFSLKKNVSKSVALSYLFLSAVSTGMAHAGVELLPSAFAMQCVTISLSYALNPVNTESAVAALTWIIIGGLVGWPFSLVLAVPYGLFVLAKRTNLVMTIVRSALNLGAIVAVIVTIDSFFYKKLVFIPINIVLYNVFGGEGEGPEIFGVEPFSYYILNLLLNFNVVFVLGYLGMLIFQFNQTYVAVNLPLAIWTLIFFKQPHKEERFLYPIYSLILVSAAITIDKLFSAVQTICSKVNPGVSRTLKWTGYVALYSAVAGCSILRTLNLVENYLAPLEVAKALSAEVHSNNTNVCIGREWYHFPTSFFLPDHYRLRFVQSGFDGLLPRDFEEELPLFDVTSFVPKEMNNKNIFVESTVIPFEECDYYLDNSGPTNGIEPALLQGSDSLDQNWQVVKCQHLINPDGAHPGLGRLIYIPEIIRPYIPYQVEYMEMCLLKKSITV